MGDLSEWLEENGYDDEELLNKAAETEERLSDLKLEVDNQDSHIDDLYEQLEEPPDANEILKGRDVARRALEDAFLQTGEKNIKQSLELFYEDLGLDKPYEPKERAA